MEKCGILFFRVHVNFDGVSLTIEGALVLVVSSTNHRTVDASVNVGSQHGIGIDLTIINERSELLELGCRTNLIDTIDIGKCPCSCGDNAQQRSQTQIQ